MKKITFLLFALLGVITFTFSQPYLTFNKLNNEDFDTYMTTKMDCATTFKTNVAYNN